MKVVGLATCHNRRELTLRALRALQEQALPAHSELKICLVDDGSSDGTGHDVRAHFPSVKLLDGPGNLYWAGGMRFGWQQYVANHEYDYLLVFNDDTSVHENAVMTLLSAARELEANGCAAFAVTGALADPRTGETTYGGVTRSSWWHPLRFEKIDPADSILECDTLNMNFALINRVAIETVGFLDPSFVHGKADYDFGLRLRARGGRVVLAPGYLGSCQLNAASEKSIHPGLTFRERWRRLTSIKEQSPRERAIYFRRHAGFLWPLYWIMPYLRACVESGAASLKRRLIGGRGS